MRVDDVGALTLNFVNMRNPIFHMIYVEAAYAKVRAEFQSPIWAEFFKIAAEPSDTKQETIFSYSADRVETELWKNLGQKNGWLIEGEYQERGSHYG